MSYIRYISNITIDKKETFLVSSIIWGICAEIRDVRFIHRNTSRYRYSKRIIACSFKGERE